MVDTFYDFSLSFFCLIVIHPLFEMILWYFLNKLKKKTVTKIYGILLFGLH